MEWISVKTDKPNDLQEVNVTFVNHCPPPYYASIKNKPFTGTCVYFDGEWFWYSSTTRDLLAEYGRCDSEKVDSAIEITHWMPLPEPPKGAEENAVD